MPEITVGDSTIYYEDSGQGHPLLLLAPGGLLSHIELWRTTRDGKPRDYPDPIAEFSKDFRVIAVDQRNAGRSRAPVRASDGWHTYLQDHLGVLDALGIDRFHVLGSCIGSSFALKLAAAAPNRVASAILQQPIGLTKANANGRAETFDQWGANVQRRDPSVTDADLLGFKRNLFDHDFVFSITRDELKSLQVQLLVLGGNDILHPTEISDEIVALAPNVTRVNDWKGDASRKLYIDSIRNFLQAHSPVGGVTGRQAAPAQSASA